MKRFSFPSLFVLIPALIAMALIMVGASRQNTALAVSGLALGFAAIMIGSLISSMIKIKKRFPLRDDPFQKKIRAARYLKSFSSLVITIGMIMLFVGVFMSYTGTKLYLYISWALLIIGFGMSIAGSIMLAVISKQMPSSQTACVVSAVTLPGISSLQIPYSPDPVISRILANPYVLHDERIRQLHEVQNLLQYPEIQQVFFEPTKLYTLFAQERVGALLNIVRDWIIRNNAEEIFAAAEQRCPVNTSAATVQPNKTAQTNSSKKVRVVTVILFIAVWLTVFVVIAFETKASS